MNAAEILTMVSIAVSGWTLHEVIRLGKDVAVLKSHHKPKPQDDDDAA